MLTLIINCTSTPTAKAISKKIDIEKYMGTWYVVGNRPTFLEKDAYAAVDIYTYDPIKDEISIEFIYNEGSLIGPKKKFQQKGKVHDKEFKTTWKVFPIWPLSFSFLILDFDPDYQWTLVGVPDQAYVWIMTRTPNIKEIDYENLISRLSALGYDTQNIRKIPH
jgi:apolipoprotein D and lipocalin family protein